MQTLLFTFRIKLDPVKQSISYIKHFTSVNATRSKRQQSKEQKSALKISMYFSPRKSIMSITYTWIERGSMSI